MRAVIQRVSRASVAVEGKVVGRIGQGFLVLVGVEVDDAESDAKLLAEKVSGLRVFIDADGKFNRSLHDVQGSALIVSQFTLHGDCRKGRRPSFVRAAAPALAIPLYESVIAQCRGFGIPVETGVFGAHMDVELVNDGPVTILVDTKKTF
jgi:D-tyrosyl-tRNA(Tyr) deacylase